MGYGREDALGSPPNTPNDAKAVAEGATKLNRIASRSGDSVCGERILKAFSPFACLACLAGALTGSLRLRGRVDFVGADYTPPSGRASFVCSAVAGRFPFPL